MNNYNLPFRCLAICLCLLLVACREETPQPASTETPVLSPQPATPDTPMPPPTPTGLCQSAVLTTPIERAEIEVGEMIVPDQIILTGTPDHVNIILRQFVQEINPDPIDPFEFPLQIGEGPTSINLFGLQPRPPGSPRTQADVFELAGLINEFASNPPDEIKTEINMDGLRVIAEPNYLTNLPIGGSGQDGGSGIVGSPDGTISHIGQGRDLFSRQWAFDEANSIHLFDPPDSTVRSAPEYKGEGVRIVAFDTTPLPAGYYFIDWAVDGFHLCVWQPGLRFGDTGSDEERAFGDEINKGEHGLFAVGLAQGVAPQASFYLVEVLDDQARGDVYTLIRSMIMFLNLEPSAGQKTVYNLSLGLAAIRNSEKLDEIALSALDALEKNILENYANNYPRDYAYLRELTSQFPIASLKSAVEYIHQDPNVLIVAASGNDYTTRSLVPASLAGKLVAQAPAAFSDVVGVASSNSDGDPSCFSNPGNVAAPSGDGIGSCEEHTPAACPDQTIDCDKAVISLVANGPLGPGYAFWTGTSFSTPMVSGLSALILGASPGLPAEEAQKVIRCSADGQFDRLPDISETQRLGAGLVNVREALTVCLP